MREIDRIVIHCSDTPDGRPVIPTEIDAWHRERGFVRQGGWRRKCNPQFSALGYHFVIATGGGLFSGRHLDETGAHVRGYNATSVGVCLVGRGRFTPAQWRTICQNVTALLKAYPNAKVVGHRDLDPLKSCPCFDVAAWLAAGMRAPAGHVLTPEAA